ncbi:MAG: response regulator [Nannocystaceae bacterium]|nr:response regulator [Nannocystaceae bacterium]
MVRRQTKGTLEEAGFEVVLAVNGLDALERLTDEISCVLCDVNMPTMNGVEFLEAARESGRHMPPVIMVTTESEAHLIRRVRALGAAGWILKPYKPESLVATVRKLIDRAEAVARCAS